jgi:hypothetical protein
MGIRLVGGVKFRWCVLGRCLEVPFVWELAMAFGFWLRNLEDMETFDEYE